MDGGKGGGDEGEGGVMRKGWRGGNNPIQLKTNSLGLELGRGKGEGGGRGEGG